MNPRALMRITAAAALALAAATAGAQYRWIGPDGVVGYGDVPPAGARNVQPFKSRPTDPSADRDLPYEVKRAAERFPVTLYTGADCGAPCEAARALLTRRGVPHAERLVVSSADVEAFRRATGAGTVPVMSVGTRNAVGFEPGAWNALLDSAGYPANSQMLPGWKPGPAQPMNTPAAAPAAAPTQPAQ